MHRVIRFRTSAFDVTKERTNPINPIHGESLLHWLSEKWPDGQFFTKPAPEDWGWYAELFCGGRQYMLGASCSDEPEGDREWVLQIVKVRSFSEKLLGRARMTADDECFLIAKRLLEGESAFHSLAVVA